MIGMVQENPNEILVSMTSSVDDHIARAVGLLLVSYCFSSFRQVADVVLVGPSSAVCGDKDENRFCHSESIGSLAWSDAIPA